jgi:dUTP pyrophosphatase
MIVKFKKLSRNAQVPTYGTPGSACFDFYSADKLTIIRAGDMQAIRTGLAIEIPEGHALMIYSRSGHGYKRVALANCVGVIDSDYRGEIKILMKNDGFFHLDVNPGDRIAQGMIIPVNQVTFEEGELSDTVRGTGGFGSTGQ